MQKLVDLNLVTRHGYFLYNTIKYRCISSLYPKEDEIIAWISTDSLAAEGDYLSAAIIDKLRVMAVNGTSEITKSAAEFKSLLYSEKSLTHIRTVMDTLTGKRIIKRKYLVGRKFRYELNCDLLLNRINPEVINELGEDLTDIFCRYKELLGVYTPKHTRAKWASSLKLMITENTGVYETLRNAMAFLCINYRKSEYSRIFRTPAILKNKYQALPVISNRKAKRYLYRLKKGMIVRHKEKNAEETLKRLDDAGAESWQKAITWVNGNIESLRYNFNKSRAGVHFVTFEDYRSQALTIAKRVYDNASVLGYKNVSSKIFYKLLSFMSLCRDKVAEKKETLEGQREYKNSIVKFVYDCENADGINVYKQALINMPALDAVNDLKTIEADSKKIQAAVNAALLTLPELNRKIICDYYGFDGRKHTQKELHVKYDVSIGKIHNIIVTSKKILKNTLSPPG
jgi:hypothetical protein